MRIVVDAMGGDYAPGEIVSGAVQAARDFGDEIILVGREADVKAALGEAASLPNIRVVHASEIIDMDEHPANAVKNKPDASIVVGMKLLKGGQADAFVSMGNTGGVLAAALFNLGRIKGVQRPALAALFPVKDGWAVMLDMGANADVRPDWLVQFGMMGSVYAERVYQKHPDDDDVLVCYCFRHTVGSIRAELLATGTSAVVDAVTTGIQAGQCACDIRNPQGTCCLGNVVALVTRLRDELGSG